MRDFMRHPTLAPSSVVSSMLVHGVLPTEEAKLATMWAQLGYSRTSIAMPVWVHGVESAAVAAVPAHLTYDAGNPTGSIGYLADQMRSKGWDYGGDGNVVGNSYVYDEPGTYLISMTVMDAEGLTQTGWMTVTVVPEPAAGALLCLAAATILRKRPRRTPVWTRTGGSSGRSE